MYNCVIFLGFCTLYPRLCKGVKWLIKDITPVFFFFFFVCLPFFRAELHTASRRHSCGPVLQGSAWCRQSKVHRSPRGATCRMFYANSSHVGRTLSLSALLREMADIITAYHGRSENSLLCAAVGLLLTQREPNHKPFFFFLVLPEITFTVLTFIDWQAVTLVVGIFAATLICGFYHYASRWRQVSALIHWIIHSTNSFKNKTAYL